MFCQSGRFPHECRPKAQVDSDLDLLDPTSVLKSLTTTCTTIEREGNQYVPLASDSGFHVININRFESTLYTTKVHRRLQQEDEEPLLWIDSICIHQSSSSGKMETDILFLYCNLTSQYYSRSHEDINLSYFVSRLFCRSWFHRTQTDNGTLNEIGGKGQPIPFSWPTSLPANSGKPNLPLFLSLCDSLLHPCLSKFKILLGRDCYAEPRNLIRSARDTSVRRKDCPKILDKTYGAAENLLLRLIKTLPFWFGLVKGIKRIQVRIQCQRSSDETVPSIPQIVGPIGTRILPILCKSFLSDPANAACSLPANNGGDYPERSFLRMISEHEKANAIDSAFSIPESVKAKPKFLDKFDTFRRDIDYPEIHFALTCELREGHLRDYGADYFGNSAKHVFATPIDGPWCAFCRGWRCRNSDDYYRLLGLDVFMVVCGTKYGWMRLKSWGLYHADLRVSSFMPRSLHWHQHGTAPNPNRTPRTWKMTNGPTLPPSVYTDQRSTTSRISRLIINTSLPNATDFSLRLTPTEPALGRIMDHTSHNTSSHVDTSHVDTAIHYDTIWQPHDTASHHHHPQNVHNNDHALHGHHGHHGHHSRRDTDPPPPYYPSPNTDPAHNPLVHNSSLTVYYNTFPTPRSRHIRRAESWTPQLCFGIGVWILGGVFFIWFVWLQIQDLNRSNDGYPPGNRGNWP
ncbi:uncharacterized protein BDR25DRAFT_361138 [Lindgomyces ingoldianus]|uniref:Uncharacterized protein n=1 Tax=Lindgomyces ingoldianus TaxID=673940 RepID=A0ACB6QD57_9PLEO|nr:uncharacterized protein BDR25DRAFT_361138 [Lindgomyces ingoldianus]KAF2464914.1 hypothetical protein BDR25DRAFT_361138 [Lindgomyces ingoldianus]